MGSSRNAENEARKAAKAQELAARKAEKKAVSEEKKRVRAEERQLKKEAAEQKKAADLESYGREVTTEVFGGNVVKFYEKGYVKISFGNDFEKLLGVEGSADSLQKKSAAGRAVGAVFTMGANVMLGSNKRGDLLVTITTDRKVHTLHHTAPYEHDLKAYHRIVSVGKSLVEQNLRELAGPTGRVESSLGDELEKLVLLKNSGALSEEEFAKAKSRLLGS
jgi:23S rRNA pseudoU1915 N3-methylase RlmH